MSFNVVLRKQNTQRGESLIPFFVGFYTHMYEYHGQDLHYHSDSVLNSHCPNMLWVCIVQVYVCGWWMGLFQLEDISLLF